MVLNKFYKATTDTEGMLHDESINTIAIVTQHNSHARFVKSALENGKNVFVEKPLAINYEELDAIRSTYKDQIKKNF